MSANKAHAARAAAEPAVMAQCMEAAGQAVSAAAVQAIQFWAFSFDQAAAMTGTATHAAARGRSWYRRPLDSPVETVLKLWNLPVPIVPFMPGLAAPTQVGGAWPVPRPAMMPTAMTAPAAMAFAAFWPVNMMQAWPAALQPMAPLAAAWGFRAFDPWR